MNNPTPRIVFYSSRSEYTLRFVNKLGLPSLRLPMTKNEALPAIKDDYVLIIPTFGAGKIEGSIPQSVLRFLNEDPAARNHCRGVVGGGNTTFGAFATSADLISRKLSIPIIHKFEMLGLPEDVAIVRNAVLSYFPEQAALLNAPPGFFMHASLFGSAKASY